MAPHQFKADGESQPLLDENRVIGTTTKRNKWLYVAGGVIAGATLFSLGAVSGAGIVLHAESSSQLSEKLNFLELKAAS
jgi:uncharacterized membrane protein YhiD involved in acid resistance